MGGIGLRILGMLVTALLVSIFTLAGFPGRPPLPDDITGCVCARLRAAYGFARVLVLVKLLARGVMSFSRKGALVRLWGKGNGTCKQVTIGTVTSETTCRQKVQV